MNIRCLSVAALTLAVLRPTTSWSQSAGPDTPRTRAEQSLQTLPNLSDVMRPGYFLTLQASSDSKTGTAAVAVENAAGSLTTSLSFSSPLSDATKEATPLTLRGVPNSGTASIGLHWFRWPGQPDAAAMKLMCRQVLNKEDCDDGEFKDAGQRAAFLRLSHAGDTPVILNIRASLGRAGFSYLDRATLASHSEAHNNWSAEFGVGRYAPATGYIGVGYQYQHRFEGGSSTEICRPLGATLATQCKSSVLGAPGEKQSDIGTIEWRYFFPKGRVALSPSLARDFKGRVTAVDAPVYFLTRSTGGISGGARVGWRSDTRNDVRVAVFIGTSLGLTP